MARKKASRQKKKSNLRSKVSKSSNCFVCPICRRGFTRRETVKDPHFPSCVRRYGNPKGLRWDEDPSCWITRAEGPERRRVVDQSDLPSSGYEGGEDDAKEPERGEEDDRVK